MMDNPSISVFKSGY